MRLIIRLIICIAVTSTTLSCSTVFEAADMGRRENLSEQPFLTVDEAKAAFNSQSTSRTRSDNVLFEDNNILTLGIVEPCWTDTLYSENGRVVSMDTGIQSSCRYMMYREADSSWVDIYSRIVAVKHRSTCRTAIFAVLYLPAENYMFRYQNINMDNVLNNRVTNDFTGLYLYTSVAGMPVGASRYVNGRCEESVWLGNDQSPFDERVAAFNEMLKGVRLVNVAASQTRLTLDPGYTNVPDGQYYVYIDENGVWHYSALIDEVQVIFKFKDNNYEILFDDFGGNGSSSGGGSEYGGGGGSSNNGNSDETDKDDDKRPKLEEIDPDLTLGRQAIAKMKTDLQNGDAPLSQVKLDNEGNTMLENVVNGVGIGANANGIITSCINFLDINNVEPLAKNFGNALGAAGLLVSLSQTFIVCWDGDLSNSDIMSCISTALSAAGFAFSLFPPTIVIGGILGVTGCVVGLIGSLMSDNLPRTIELELPTGNKIYIFIV